MRKLVASINVTLDSYMSGPNCELDWHFERWGPDLAQAFGEQLSKADTILLGRVTYCAMAHYWPQKSQDLSYPRDDIAFADMMNNYKKIVFTHTLKHSVWDNSILVKGNLKKEILKLKKQKGKDIIIYGSGKLVASLVELGLIDEYVLWVHPVVLGEGKPMFKYVPDILNMKLEKITAYSSGVVMLCYQPVKELTTDNTDLVTERSELVRNG
jgi:dihydrofolate reductase